jgi:Nucleotidyl transferase AbiEii toxin, Type IV TA system
MDFFRELIDLTDALDAAGVDYALCGGVALAIHGVPRATQDIDLLVRPEDLEGLRKTARTCGFGLESFPMDFSSGITIQRFTKLVDGQPLMLDALLVGKSLETVWNGRQTAEIEGGRMRVVSRDGLIALKLAAARPQDLVDVQRLQEIHRG